MMSPEAAEAFVNQYISSTAILILAKSRSRPRNTGMVITSEQPNRARAVERTGFV
jgi:hypothetical protein